MPGKTGEVGHILVVDDDAMVRQTITNYLEEHNVPAASVSCRQDLSRHLEKAHPSLILLDLRLGHEDGLDVLKEIRSYSDVPIIIIMTGHGREEVDHVVGLELGADDLLSKAVRPQRIAGPRPCRLTAARKGPRRASPRPGEGRVPGLTAGRLNVAAVASSIRMARRFR
jgi:DNA-binding response OmpR family regulator